MHKSYRDLFRSDGTAKGASAGAIAIGRLLQMATYRDEAGGGRGHVKYDYNTPSQLLRTEDQATNALENVQDPEGRVSAGKRTTLGSGFEVAAMPVLEPSRAKDLCGHYLLNPEARSGAQPGVLQVKSSGLQASSPH